MASGLAFGKVILLGEHAVVYGEPAIAVAIDRGARARAVRSPTAASHIRVSPTPVAAEHQAALDRALAEVLELTPCDGPVRVDVETELPPGGGLGCSAAMGVAVSRALDPNASAEEVVTRATAWERVFHGNPSGVDVAVSAGGGCVVFRKGTGARRLRVGGALTLCIGSTGVASSTLAMVEAVARLRAGSPTLVAALFSEMGALVQEAEDAIGVGDGSRLGRAMDGGQELLARLRVSSPDIDGMCETARQAGALGVKLTGAGGGGCVVALASGIVAGERVLEAWQRGGRQGFLSRVEPGLPVVVPCRRVSRMQEERSTWLAHPGFQASTR
jgi:mevalonate kinase